MVCNVCWCFKKMYAIMYFDVRFSLQRIRNLRKSSCNLTDFAEAEITLHLNINNNIYDRSIYTTVLLKILYLNFWSMWHLLYILSLFFLSINWITEFIYYFDQAIVDLVIHRPKPYILVLVFGEENTKFTNKKSP